MYKMQADISHQRDAETPHFRLATVATARTMPLLCIMMLIISLFSVEAFWLKLIFFFYMSYFLTSLSTNFQS